MIIIALSVRDSYEDLPAYFWSIIWRDWARKHLQGIKKDWGCQDQVNGYWLISEYKANEPVLNQMCDSLSN